LKENSWGSNKESREDDGEDKERSEERPRKVKRS